MKVLMCSILISQMAFASVEARETVETLALGIGVTSFLAMLAMIPIAVNMSDLEEHAVNHPVEQAAFRAKYDVSMISIFSWVAGFGAGLLSMAVGIPPAGVLCLGLGSLVSHISGIYVDALIFDSWRDIEREIERGSTASRDKAVVFGNSIANIALHSLPYLAILGAGAHALVSKSLASLSLRRQAY
ncbi:MAG: hypothetical protein V4534_00565 [Myxococcota bacterium]